MIIIIRITTSFIIIIITSIGNESLQLAIPFAIKYYRLRLSAYLPVLAEPVFAGGSFVMLLALRNTLKSINLMSVTESRSRYFLLPVCPTSISYWV
jgi:hypothetical protein